MFVRMRAAIAISILVTTLAGCQSTGGGTDGVPASMVPPAMDATATTAGGAPADIADLVNAPATRAQGQMQARGYAFTQQQGSTTYWWNPKTTICATTVTSNGKFQIIGTATAHYCGQQ
ncbi:hypothetical protein J2X72_004608 [Phyllobacterium sp. 1468]|uniref:hypothetical protein n=1 Tax=Phyllobacterium sp. 1468 TaxID=2817759 RepID=UPI001AE2217A|nr:hypothetical protein [Phyllobacterium sp. 1468]MDR6635794.1 hypothetical protein [Phyllobacterium sp. 1468]